AFEREDALARSVFCGHRAGDDGAVVNDDRAATALPGRAASVFRRDDAALVAQHFEQRRVVFNLSRARLLVQRELDASRHKQSSLATKLVASVWCEHFSTFVCALKLKYFA